MKKRTLLTTGVIGLFLSILLSDLMENALRRPATNLMTFVKKGRFNSQELNSRGIPLMTFNRVSGEEYFNPVYIGMYGLKYYDIWLENGESKYFLDYYILNIPSGESIKKDHIINISDWYCENIIVRTHEGFRYGVWQYDFEWPYYKLEKGWISGMAQGIAIQNLLRSYSITLDTIYLETAALALNSFNLSVKDGGVTIKDTEDEWWFEEYAGINAVESRVLNGMLHSLIALHEYQSLEKDELSKNLLLKGTNALIKSLPNYANDWWTYYDAIGTVAKLKYHKININLLKYYYSKVGDQRLLIYRDWERLDKHFFIREFILQPPNYLDLTILGLNTIWICLILLLSYFIVLQILNNWRLHAGKGDK